MSDSQERQPEKLCTACEGFIAAASNNKEWQDHRIYRPYRELNLSASTGCPLCIILVSAAAAQSTSKGIFSCSGDKIDGGCVVVEIQDNRNGPRIHLNPVSATKVKFEGLENTTSSSKSLQFAKQSLENCVTTHGHSKNTNEKKCLTPTRLIELGEKKCQLRLSAQLKELGENPAYATLSHCWGSVEQQSSIFKLLTTNIEDLCQEIPMTKLCKTFKEAIEVTKSLGYEYLWIDSLCIIQDDKTDWLKESSLMSTVYGGSIVTIAATGATDGSNGLFFQRDGKSYDRQFCRTSMGQVWEIRDEKYSMSTYVDDAPLATRGWVFQERFLSQRTVHFTSKQIVMECQEGINCEAWPSGIPGESWMRSPPRYFPKTTDMRDWRKVVEFYSKLNLTYPQDKLVALSGVSRQFFDRYGHKYCAGLWWRNIELQLLWRCIESKGPRVPKYFPDRAPSWSWAVCDGQVEHFAQRNEREFLSRAVRCTCDSIGPDPFGQIRGAQLQMRCFPLVRETSIHCLLGVSRDSYRGKRSKTFELDRLEDWDSCEDMYYLFIAEPEIFGYSLSGLVVKKVEGEDRGRFCRVGTFTHYFDYSEYEELRMILVANAEDCLDTSLYEKEWGEEDEEKYKGKFEGEDGEDDRYSIWNRNMRMGLKYYLITLV
ncbi:hypothetical protein HYFRA_00001340 [Hymenoscyphus fraxineus]|uniref:Heterokaryon incompatibility domain-containing protein n=1 Tax=Hymenoscyphus fraxineus TaxID=746836 RepID=A0A9N9L9J2_9HELO|nr:hypothetical protein HYFRA_00001340 [Hymenoscyphus fraxineus]